MMEGGVLVSRESLERLDPDTETALNQDTEISGNTSRDIMET